MQTYLCTPYSSLSFCFGFNFWKICSIHATSQEVSINQGHVLLYLSVEGFSSNTKLHLPIYHAVDKPSELLANNKALTSELGFGH